MSLFPQFFSPTILTLTDLTHPRTNFFAVYQFQSLKTAKSKKEKKGLLPISNGIFLFFHIFFSYFLPIPSVPCVIAESVQIELDMPPYIWVGFCRKGSFSLGGGPKDPD